MNLDTWNAGLDKSKLGALGGTDPAFIENLYEKYKHDPSSFSPSWQAFFQNLEKNILNQDTALQPAVDKPLALEFFNKEVSVINMIDAYRTRGHFFTKLHPVRDRIPYSPNVNKEMYGLTEADLDTVFQSGDRIGIGPAKLKDIITHLDTTYCQSVGCEYRFIRHPDILAWLEKKMDTVCNTADFSVEEKLRIFRRTMQAVVFEKFMHTRFVGQKRFSLEGGETIIPALHTIVDHGVSLGIEELIIGMAHRGRLNVLANVMKKPYLDIFSEFAGKGYAEQSFAGDVKYHMGYSSDRMIQKTHRVHLSMPANPSHLEAINPVVQGIARAKIDKRFQGDNTKIVPIILHGDASIAGQGIVYEVIQMSDLKGYLTGGTVHIVLNNQIGFTTSYLDARSSTYCTDIAKIGKSPVFHVNADDVEAVIYTVQLALEFRQTFHRDVFIDILGYRKHGHNEGDDPRFTQPLMYARIAKHKDPQAIYAEKLIQEGVLTADRAKAEELAFRATLEDAAKASQDREKQPLNSFFAGDWKGYRLASAVDIFQSPDSSIPEAQLQELTVKINTLPADKEFFWKIKKLFADRQEMVLEQQTVDWAMAELLAYASLLKEGYDVRVSGQDVCRGTFAHRHAVVKYVQDDQVLDYTPLQNLSCRQGQFMIYNSLLSEYGVLGFEFGYAMSTPKTLTIWEAQFGDFANGAQPIIDQFITSAETKWQRMNGLVMLLPHGYEGQGPEHSSARIERYLSLCADHNIQICNCTTPANFFHLLRRQMLRHFRKPLLVMTPKSLLRHPKCRSSVDSLATPGNHFEEILYEPKNTESVLRVILCSGKIYYDLTKQPLPKNIAIIRLEQIYPFPIEKLKIALQVYNNAREFFWVQEEPANMGAWPFILQNLYATDIKIKLISRPENSATASGFIQQHHREQQAIVQQALALENQT